MTILDELREVMAEDTESWPHALATAAVLVVGLVVWSFIMAAVS